VRLGALLQSSRADADSKFGKSRTPRQSNFFAWEYRRIQQRERRFSKIRRPLLNADDWQGLNIRIKWVRAIEFVLVL
jgi:hypothetical protein